MKLILPNDNTAATKKQLRADKLSEYALIATLILNVILFGYLLIFDHIPIVGYLLLLFLWMAKFILSGNLSYSTPFDISVLLLLILLPISLTFSHSLGLSLVKLHGVLLSVTTFFILINLVRNLRRLKWTIFTLIALIFIVTVLGFFGADWSSGEASLPARILAILPLPVSAIQKLTASGGIHVNTIGGTLALFVPFLLSLLLDNGAFKRAFLRKNPHAKLLGVTYKSVLSIGIMIVLFILVLTQSRGAILGTAFGIFVLLAWKDKRFLYLIPFGVLALFILMLVYADGDPVKFFLQLDTYSNPEGDTIKTRIEYWKNTIYLIQDFPITGTGIGSYGKIFHDIYSFATPLATVRPLFYAHNMYLAIAADMGLPALVLYLAIFSSFFTMVFFAIHKARSIVKTLLKGLLCGMAAHMVYGLMDNYMLGEKLGLLVWTFFGIGTAIYVHRKNLFHYYSDSPDFHENVSSNFSFIKILSRSKELVWGLAAWIVISVIGISFINVNPLISLSVTVTGGIMMGIVVTRRFELQHQSELVGLDG